VSGRSELPGHTRVEHPERVSPEELDAYLARGWYRIGQAMVTCRFVWSHERALRSAVWTRTPVAAHRPTRNQRRLMRRNLEKYVVSEGPLRPDGEHEAVYRRYLKAARGERPPRLYDTLFGGHVRDRFATRELAIRDSLGRLVAFSAFDLGRTSLQSLMGVYDPACADDSLGFWSLLLEVEHARRLGLAYHYSGYVLPGDPSMDYKLRIAPIEFLDPDRGVWLPWEAFGGVHLPVDRLDQRLDAVARALEPVGVPSRIESYHPYEAPIWNPSLERAFAHPRALRLLPGGGTLFVELVAWDLDLQRYSHVRCFRAPARAEAQGDEPARTIELWVESARADLSDDPAEVAAYIEAKRRIR
jgi:arginyl-tRNA--protein-N-Asp/Glu arginylyltransferase